MDKLLLLPPQKLTLVFSQLKDCLGISKISLTMHTPSTLPFLVVSSLMRHLPLEVIIKMFYEQHCAHVRLEYSRGYQTHAGLATGLKRVWVWVHLLQPSVNPYPCGGFHGFCGFSSRVCCYDSNLISSILQV